MKISLVMVTKDAARVRQYIGQALSIAPLFDEVIIHSNKYESNVWIPQHRNSIILFENTPISCADALNKVVGQAKGDWILPLCDDDYCDHEPLEQIINNMRLGFYDQYDVVYAPMMYGNEKIGWTTRYKFEANWKNLQVFNPLPFTSFYKKSVWEEIGGYKNLPFNDWVFYLELAKKNKKFLELEKPYFHWRYNHMGEQSLCDHECKVHSFEGIKKQVLAYLETRPC